MNSYKICFLGYPGLTEMAKKTIEDMKLSDTEFMLRDCTPGTLREVLGEAVSNGFEVFVGGGSNYAKFKQISTLYIQELQVTEIDYLVALKKAELCGHNPAIVLYKYSQPVDIPLLSQLLGKEVGLLVYEDILELRDLIEKSEYDVLIGTTVVREYALQCGRQYVLAYAGDKTIRTAIMRARNTAAFIRREQRFSTINRALIQDTNIGIIISNENGYITMINRKAEEYLGVDSGVAKGRLLTELQKNLVPRARRASEFFSVIQGVRLRCTQQVLLVKGELIGHFTTLRIDNSRLATLQKEKLALQTELAYQWHDMITESSVMKKAINYGKTISDSTLPCAIVGEQGTHKKLFAECLHSGSTRAKKPLLILNLSTISVNDAGRHLLGCSDPMEPHTGLLEMANGGTVVLRNLNHSNPAVQSCLLDAVTYHQITPTGGYKKIGLNIRFVTILDTPIDMGEINTGLFSLLTTQIINVPAIRDRKEDIVPLFKREIELCTNKPFRLKRFERAAGTLCWYEWLGNLSEIQAAASRLASMHLESSNLTQSSVYRAVIDSIGKEKLIQQAADHYEASDKSDEAFALMVNNMCDYAGMTLAEVADQLGMSRTTLWRKMGEK